MNDILKTTVFKEGCFTEFHSIHRRVYEFYMYTFSMYINRIRSSLEIRYQKVEEISIIVAQTIGNFIRYFPQNAPYKNVCQWTL